MWSLQYGVKSCDIYNRLSIRIRDASDIKLDILLSVEQLMRLKIPSLYNIKVDETFKENIT